MERTHDNTDTNMTGFWRTMADITGEKLEQLGLAGTILGVIWVIGLWVWFDWMMGAYREAVPQAGNYLLGFLIAWFVIGLAIYLWRDPHQVRESALR